MLLSLALLFLTALTLAKLCKLIKLPSLIGMLLTGIILGPTCLNVLDIELLQISSYLREIALIIILTRAGLNIDWQKLKNAGKSTIFMCFVPAIFEMVLVTILAPVFLNIDYDESFLLATILAAVSPAVIVPKMLQLQEEGYGKDKSIPQVIMASASVDDIFVIVLFTTTLQSFTSSEINTGYLLQIPTSIIFGVIGGIIIGNLLAWFFKKYRMRDSVKVIIVLSYGFLAVTLQDQMTGVIGFSGLLSIMAMGITLKLRYQKLSNRLSQRFSKLWVPFEVLLFVLVGAGVNLQLVSNSGLIIVLLIIIALLARSVGVYVSLIGSIFTKKERIFIAIAYLPKATVQAAIGGIPLASGLECGEVVLTVAILSILISAPIGSILIDKTYKKLLNNSQTTTM